MAALLLLLLTVGALFSSSDAQNAYNNLPDDYKKGVDLTLERLNTSAEIQHHYLFFRSLQKSGFVVSFGVKFIYHHFLLKATKCPKGTVDSSGCQFRNDRPLIDCGVCYKTLAGEIEHEPEPYVLCVPRAALTEVMKAVRVQNCMNMAYVTGGSTIWTI